MPWKDINKRQEHDRKRAKTKKRKEQCKKYNQSEKGKAHRRKRRKLNRKPRKPSLKEILSENEYKLRIKGSYVERKFGISLKQYNEMLEVQNNKCYICGRRGILFKKGLGLDHNHNTNKIRKFLCPRCNIFVGFYEQYPHLIDKIELYIEDKL